MAADAGDETVAEAADQTVVDNAGKATLLGVLIVDDVEDRMIQMAIEVETTSLDDRTRRYSDCCTVGDAHRVEIALIVAIDVVVAEAGAAQPGPFECTCRV